MTKIYISGKISGLSESEYKANFKIAELQVMTLSYIVFMHYDIIINPLDITPLFGIKRWFFFMWNDLKALRKCTHIAMMPNWIYSCGACIEHFIAKFIFKLEVIYL